MKMGYNRIYQTSNIVCSFGRLFCTALIPAPQASFIVQFQEGDDAKHQGKIGARKKLVLGKCIIVHYFQAWSMTGSRKR